MEDPCGRVAIIVRDTASCPGAERAAAPVRPLYHRADGGALPRPGREHLSVAVDAPADAISALSGKIGRLAGITAKTVYAPEDALQQGK